MNCDVIVMAKLPFDIFTRIGIRVVQTMQVESIETSVVLVIDLV